MTMHAHVCITTTWDFEICVPNRCSLLHALMYGLLVVHMYYWYAGFLESVVLYFFNGMVGQCWLVKT